MLDARAIPGPSGRFFIGNLADFARAPLEYLCSVAEEFGDVAQLRFGPRRMFLINDPDYIREIFVSRPQSFRKGLALQYAKPVLGEGLLTSEGELHRRQRRMMQPAFHMKRIQEYADTMVKYTTDLLDTWTDGEVRPVSKDMMDLTLRIIAKTMFGYETSAETKQIGEALDVLMDYVMHRVNSVIKLPNFIPTTRERQLKRATRDLNNTIYQVIDERRRSGGNDNGDLLSMLLTARDETDGLAMSDAQLRDEVMTIFLAGHETTANTMTWTWYLLSQHPEVANKLFDEVDEVLNGKAAGFNDIPRLVYTNKILKESMRLFPAAWTVGYEAVEDVQVGQWAFKKGDGFFMSQYVMHRNPLFYDKPYEFLPDRWTEEFVKGLPPFAYFPFGGGPRICIGNQFALMEAALLTATIAQRYRLEYVGERPPVPNPQITLRPTDDVYMRVVARK